MMTKYWIIVLVSAFIVSLSHSFNLENRLPIYKFDDDESSYFGYSVALHREIDEDKNWILVGAPLGRNPQPNTNRSGTLKRCPVSQNQYDCQDVLTDGRLTDDDHNILPPLPNEIKEGQWLGVTVSTQKNVGSGMILVCAHRYISKSGNSYDHAQYGIGLCYILANDFSYNDVFEPCKGRKMEKLHEEYGVCQAGTSGSLLSDGTVAIGAPGVYTWRGSLYMKSIEGEYLKRDKQTYYSPHENSNSQLDKYSYLGMSVTGGYYFGKNSFIYVGGAPRSSNHGQVMFYEKKKQNPMSLRQKLDGEQIASGFGYEMVTADVNGDDLPDLLVSAPFYFGRHEGGAVYVYLNNDKKIGPKFDLKLTGKIESRFGISLASLGDINKDFMEDIAIGAPYEDDGVVYIYLGSRAGLSKTPSQIIRASDLGLRPDRKITTFGSFLSSGLDVDKNDYPDLIIGAYNSSAAVVLLSRPIISISTVVPQKGSIKAIDPSIKGCQDDQTANVTCFSFKTCCSIDLDSSQKFQTLSIFYTIEAETFKGQKKFSRVYFGYDDDGNRRNVSQRHFDIATNGNKTCFNEIVYLKEGSRDIQSPIKFHINYTMVEKPLKSSGLIELNPILDQTQADRNFEVDFQKDCGNDDICESQLEVESTLGLERQRDGSYAFVLGKNEEIQVNVNVINLADSAYESQLFVFHQSSVTYIAASTKGSVICNQFNSTVVSCTLGNPLKRNATAHAILRFDPIGIADDEPQATFTVFANTTSKQITPRADIHLSANIIKQADLSLSGYARPAQVFYGGENKGESAMKHFEDLGTQVIHTYQINNEGPWKAPYVDLDIDWPHQVGNDKPQGKWLLYLEEIPFVESTGGSNGECSVKDPKLLNPLNLSNKLPNDSKISSALMEDPALVKRSNKSHTFAREYREKISSSYSASEKKNNDEAILNRVRRDRAKIIKPEKLVDRDGKKSNIVSMNCKRNTAKCIRITCRIYNLARKTEVYVHIKSRLWNATLTTDYPRVDNVKIYSSAKLVIPKIYGIHQNIDDDAYEIETHAYPELGDQKPIEEIPWWIIILGILFGLILLALFIFCLYKCGFFKRRRPDPTLSGNLEKNNESKPFITK